MDILLALGNQHVAAFLQRALGAQGYSVQLARSPDDVFSRLRVRACAFLILDLDIPGADGVELLRQIRASNDTIPILVLSARACVEDRVRGLDAGADDFLAMPFAFRELAARIRAVSRRAGAPRDIRLRVEDLDLDLLERKAKRGHRTIELSAKEFRLLEALMSSPGRPVSRGEILDKVFGKPPNTDSNLVDVYICYLRKKIDEGEESKLVHSVYRAGYMIGKPDRKPSPAPATERG